MFPLGHYGMALALYAVVGYVLLRRDRVHDALCGGGIVLAYTLFPDLDGQLEFLVHRGVSHTLWFALAVGALCLLVVAPDLRGRSRREAILGGSWAFFLGAFAVVAHLLADVLNPWGVMPLYPVSPALYSLELVYAGNDAANYAMLAAGVGIAVAAWFAGRPGRERPTPALRLYRRLREREPTAE